MAWIEHKDKLYNLDFIEIIYKLALHSQDGMFQIMLLYVDGKKPLYFDTEEERDEFFIRLKHMLCN